MFYQVNTGAANYAQTFPAFHRRDGGANALTGIRAAHSAFIKRHDPANADPEHAQTATDNAAAGIAAANRLANATKTEASAFLQGAKETMRSGSYTALDILESTEDGRAILAKLKASDDGIEILHSPDTGRVYVYTGRVEDELEIIRKREWERTYGAAAQTAAPAAQHADTVEISDEGRELAANQIRIIDKDMLNEMGSGLSALKLRVNDPDNPSIEFPDGFWETVAQSKAKSLNTLDPKDSRYGDSTLLFSLYSNTDIETMAAYKLSGELGNLLRGPAETLEERVVNREKGLKLAEYIAENYINDPDAKQTFLDRAKELAKYAELQDKGYFVAMTMDGGHSVLKIDDNLLIKDGKPTEKAATAIIERVKNSLDMNAVKEDALNTFKKIMAEYLNADGTLIGRR